MSHAVMWLLALFAGSAISAGAFAFIIVIGIIPRILRKSKMTDVILIENVIIIGVIVGNILSLGDKYLFEMPYLLEHSVVIIYGISTGMFVGCMAVALAEILHTFPIIFRRTKLKFGLKAVIYSMALGKMTGAILYFIFGYFLTD